MQKGLRMDFGRRYFVSSMRARIPSGARGNPTINLLHMKIVLNILGKILRFLLFLLFTVLEFLLTLLVQVFRALKNACEPK